MSVRLLIADDQALVRAGFRMILDAEDDLEVVGEAADGLAAVEQALVIEIADRGPGPAARDRVAEGDGGHGLVGMAERMRLYGGELHTGRREGGGFEVRARIPLAGDREAQPA